MILIHTGQEIHGGVGRIRCSGNLSILRTDKHCHQDNSVGPDMGDRRQVERDWVSLKRKCKILKISLALLQWRFLMHTMKKFSDKTLTSYSHFRNSIHLYHLYSGPALIRYYFNYITRFLSWSRYIDEILAPPSSGYNL